MPRSISRLLSLGGLLVASVALAPAQQQPFHLSEATISGIHAAFKSGRLNCRDLVNAYLKRIEAYNKSGPSLNAMQTVNSRALVEADRLDAAYKASGPVGPLHCIPVALKDQVETSDMPTSYGSAVFKDFTPKQDATIVTKLKAAGAIIIAKSAMGEFASGYLSSAAGAIRNAYDPKRHASGSSGGTGAAVTTNMATIGIGEDTGGSIRGPAAVSGLVGLRPTVPLVSRYGMMPARPSTDTLGPMARTVEDAAKLLDVIAGYDPHDPITSYAVGQVPPSYAAFLKKDGLKGMRIGIIRQPMDVKTDTNSADYKKVRQVVDKAIDDLKRLGAQVIEADNLPDLKALSSKLYDANEFETEAATNAYLARQGNAPVKTLREILLTGKVTPSRTKALLAGLGKTTEDPGYLQILLLREQTRQKFLTIMADQKLDAFVYATFDHQPVVIPQNALSDANANDTGTLGNNRRLSPALGFPAITVPGGLTTDGIPVGIELLARPFSEGLLFQLAYAYEQGTHNRKPPPSTPPLNNEP